MHLSIAVLLAWTLPSIALPKAPTQTYYDEAVPFRGSFTGQTYENGTQVIWSDEDPDAAPFTRHMSETALASFHAHKRDLEKRATIDCWGYQLDVRLTDLTTWLMRETLKSWGGVVINTMPAPFNTQSWRGWAYEKEGPMVYACVNSRFARYEWRVTADTLDLGLSLMDGRCRRYEAGYAAVNVYNHLLIGKTLSHVPVCLDGFA